MALLSNISLFVAFAIGAAAQAQPPPTGIAWRRTPGTGDEVTFSTTLDARGTAAPALLVQGLVEPFRVRVNGAEVRAAGPNLGLHGGWRWHEVPLRGDGPSDVSISVLHGAAAFLDRKPAYVGTGGEVLRAALRDELPRALLAFAGAVFGSLGLLIFLLRREEWLYLAFAVFALSQSFVLFAAGGLHALFLDAPGAWDHLRLAARAIAPISLLAFFALTAAKPSKRLLQGCGAVAVIGLLFVAADLATSGALHRGAQFVLNVEFLIAVGGVVVLLLRRLRVEPARYLPSAVGVVLSMLTAAAEAAGSGALLSNLYFGALAHLVLLIALGGLILRRYLHVFSALQEEIQARDEFLQVVAHELRNPLAAAVTGVDLLSLQQRHGEGAKHLDMVNRQLKRLSVLMDNLVDLGRLRSGVFEGDPQPVLVAPSIQAATEAVRPFALGQKVSMDLSCDLTTESVSVVGGPQRFQQMVAALVRHAVSQTAAGGTVSLQVRASRDQLQVRVLDGGPKLKAEAVAKLFGGSAQPGVRELPSNRGVGIALVHRLATLHGGTLELISAGEDLRGERLLLLPRAATLEPLLRETAASAPPVAPEGAPLPVALPPVKAKRRVLLIDDNANLRLSMRLLLEHSGFEVKEARDGRSGVDQLLGGTFDAAVIDLRMPELDGVEVARRVRADPVGQALTLIALTGFNVPEEHERARQAGFNEVMVKPAHPDQLARALN